MLDNIFDKDGSILIGWTDGTNDYKLGKLEIFNSTIQIKKEKAKSLFHECLDNYEDPKTINILNDIQENLMTKYIEEVIH